jgi:hypothetical protein
MIVRPQAVGPVSWLMKSGGKKDIGREGGGSPSTHHKNKVKAIALAFVLAWCKICSILYNISY